MRSIPRRVWIAVCIGAVVAPSVPDKFRLPATLVRFFETIAKAGYFPLDAGFVGGQAGAFFIVKGQRDERGVATVFRSRVGARFRDLADRSGR